MITLPQLDTAGAIAADNLLYVVQGNDVDRDRKITVSNLFAYIATRQIQEGEYAPRSIATTDIKTGAITYAELGTNALYNTAPPPPGSEESVLFELFRRQTSGGSGELVLKDESIYGQNLVDLTVSASKLGNASVTTIKLDDLAVTTDKINDLAITNGKLASQAVSYAKMGTNTLYNSANPSTGEGDFIEMFNRQTSGASGQLVLKDESVWGRNLVDNTVKPVKTNIASWQYPDASGVADDVLFAIDGSGVAVLQANTIPNRCLQDDSVQTANILDANVTRAKLASNVYGIGQAVSPSGSFYADSPGTTLIAGSSITVTSPDADTTALVRLTVTARVHVEAGKWVGLSIYDTVAGSFVFDGTTTYEAFDLGVMNNSSVVMDQSISFSAIVAIGTGKIFALRSHINNTNSPTTTYVKNIHFSAELVKTSQI